MMTDDELISHAVDAIRRYEARRAADDPFRALTVDSLQHRRVDGSTVYFASEDPNARIEITVNRETGEIVTATFALPRPSRKPTI